LERALDVNKIMIVL